MSVNPVSSLVPLTEEEVKQALPNHLRSSVTPNLVATLNSITQDDIAAENIRNNFVSYSAVIKEGKFKVEDYIHAIAYVSFKLMGDSNKDAYAKAFPARFAKLIADGRSDKDISAYVAAYHKGKLVNMIMEQSMVPSWVLNQDLFQKALNTQADLMMNSNSDKVRTDAANSILTHLKKPEAIKGQLDINVKESEGVKDLKKMLEDLALQQQQMIATGQMKTIDVAASRLINREGAEDVG